MTDQRRQLPSRFVRVVTEVLDESRVVDDPEITAPYALDWTGRFRGPPPLVLRPSAADELAAIVGAARADGVALVPQGGNTGLVGGATPLDGEVVVDMKGFSSIVDVDPLGGQITAGAGVVIADLQAEARRRGWDYGVDWGARGSATVGGSVATDAGGIRFVRHGGTRRQLLGVEAVLGTGAVVRHLPAVEKDNTGYDLGALLCGSEGTLGFVTAARLRLVSPPGPLATALIGFDRTRAAVEAASLLRRSMAGVEAVELMMESGMELVRAHRGLSRPLDRPAPAYLLVEVSAGHDVELALAEAVVGLTGVVDAAIAVDGPRRADLWRYREDHTEVINQLGPPHKFDVTMPPDHLAEFVDAAPRLVRATAPAAQVWCFGHAADGNVHVNVTGLAADDEQVADAILSTVAEAGGSISAEHGIGRAKRRWLPLARSAEDLAAMRVIKQALDPDGICNPAVLV